MALGINCPFCGEKLHIEYYSTGIKGKPGKTIIFCNSDNCAVKPCTDATTPSRAIEEAKLLGKIHTK